MKYFYQCLHPRPMTPGRTKLFNRSLLLVIVLLGLGNVHALATTHRQAVFSIELHLKDATLKQALREIERQTSYSFVLNESKFKYATRRVTLVMKANNIEQVLDTLLNGTNITYQILKKQITLIPPKDDR